VEIGQRVVVRSRTGGIGLSGGPELTDVIGHVRALTSEDVTIERRDGTTVEIHRTDIVTWKVVPPQLR
jgi:preprotein translocase subunit YajC